MRRASGAIKIVEQILFVRFWSLTIVSESCDKTLLNFANILPRIVMFASLGLILCGPLALPLALAVDPGLEPPTINTKPGPEYNDDVRIGNMIIGIDRTPK